MTLSIGDREVLKSPTTTVLESIYTLMPFRVCLMKLGALTHYHCVGVYIYSYVLQGLVKLGALTYYHCVGVYIYFYVL